MRFRSTLLFSSLTVILLGTQACSEKTSEPDEVIRPVRFQIVTDVSEQRSVSFTGVSKADTETALSFRVGGTLLKLNVARGSRIKKGDLVAALDNSDATLKYDQQLLALNKTKTQMSTAKSNLSRVKGLYENDTLPLGEYESAKEKFSNALAAYETEQRAVDLTRRELGYYTLYAPTNGVVLTRDVSINENIAVGQVIANIQTGTVLVADVGIPEQYITRVKLGQSATLRFPSLPNVTFLGKVTEVAYAISQNAPTYPVSVSIADPKNKLRPGMPTNVSFDFAANTSSKALIIPSHAVAKDDSGNYVFLLHKSDQQFGLVSKKPITVGRLTNEGFEIVNGLKQGDRVVTAGISSLADGMKVRLLK